MKRVVVPIERFHHSSADRVFDVLRTMGPEEIGYEGNARTDQDVALVGSALEKPAHEGLIVTVPDDMPLPWVEKMVGHALKDAGFDLTMGPAYTAE